MTASPGREVDPNLLSRAAPEGALPRPQAQDAGGQDLGDLVEPLGGGQVVGVEGICEPDRSHVGHQRAGAESCATPYILRLLRASPNDPVESRTFAGMPHSRVARSSSRSLYRA
jgi:hypothetical protein